MTEDTKPTDNIKPTEVAPTVEVGGGQTSAEDEVSKEDVEKNAGDVIGDIEGDVVTFRAEDGSDNPDLVTELDRTATESKEEIKRVLSLETKPDKKEQAVFDYSGASDWLELFSQIGKNMSVAEADAVIERIKAFREDKISEAELSVNPDSHIKEVVLKLKNRDTLLNEPSNEKVPEEVEAKVSSPEKTEENIRDSSKVEEEAEVDQSQELETKFDVRDAVTKGKISKLKKLLDKLNKAGNRSDYPDKKILLNEAAMALDNPNLVAESPDLGLAIGQAHIAIENKIRDLENEIRIAQFERLSGPLRELLKELNDAKTREAKLQALKNAATLLNKPYLATAILQRSKDGAELLVPDAIEMAVLLAESKLRSISEAINKSKNVVEATSETTSTDEEPIPEPEPVNPEPVKPEPEEPEPVIPEKVEKDLGYLDIDPKVIWEKMTPKDMEALQALMKAGDMTKVNEFYQTKIKEVLVDQKKESSANEELMKQMAESVNAIIQNKIQHDASTEVLKSTWKDKGVVVKNIVKNIAIMGGASLAIGALGVGTGGVGILAYAGSMTLVRLAMRKIEARSVKTIPAKVLEKEKQEQAENLEKKKAEILATIFSPDNLEKLREELSGHISNVLRVQTSERALKTLREYEQADGVKEPEVAGAKLREVEKQLYLNALTRMRAEHPEATPEQQQNMALTLALTLAQHEKGENHAKQRLEEIKKSKPRLYAIIEKFNLLNAGSPDKQPTGLNKDERNLWDKSKYDLMSLGIGTAVGVGIRTIPPVRIAMGAVAGAGIGYKVGEWMEKRDEKKALAEIVKMIDESEEKIKDIEFPAEEIEQLKKDSVFVKSKLDLGFLDGDPLLKSRAENFIHQVQKIELANQEAFKKLLESVSDRTDKRAEQVEVDLDRIGSKIKNRRLWATIGGAVIGGVGAWALSELFSKKKSDQEVSGASKPEDSADSKLGGDLNDANALHAWSENQTGNAIQHLNQEQGGNINDLVHNADKVRLSFENGKPHISFINSSGIEVGHLPDNNVAHLVEGQHFNTNTEHHFGIDPRTGDQFLEIQSGDGTLKIYDWDRDNQVNVVFPDGHNQEMSPAELSKFLVDKNIFTSAEALATQEAALKATAGVAATQASEAAAQAVADQQVESFLTQGGSYNHDLFEAAKNSGHLDDLADKIVHGSSETQTGAFVYDLARDQGWSADKANVFLGALRSGDRIDLAATGADAHGVQAIIDSMKAFERSALDSFDKVKSMPSDHWMPVKLGDDYALVQKIQSGIWPLRSDHFLIDATGDHQIDATFDDNAMRQEFEPGRHIPQPQVEELGQVAGPANEVASGASAPNNFDSSFVELAKNTGAMDSFINTEANPADRIAALVGTLPDNKLVNFNGINLSHEGSKLLWHSGSQVPLEVTANNIDSLSEVMKIVRDQTGANLPSNWESQVTKAYEQALSKK